MAERIREVHGESGGAYGSPQVTAELRAKGLRINEKRVARIMRTFSITGIRLRRRVRTTVAYPAASPVPDLFQRDFTATEPGGKYMGDITCRPLLGLIRGPGVLAGGYLGTRLQPFLPETAPRLLLGTLATGVGARSAVHASAGTASQRE
ncbi:IS3 family transposase [Streptomyces sp. NPDC058291]|uniref:IS3 family transposase n=1 Tax=Streptomyces sp. NPDC058291 TaxID=3346427 RepID=UPI0036DFD585